MKKIIIGVITLFVIIGILFFAQISGVIDLNIGLLGNNNDPSNPTNVNATGDFILLGLSDRELHQAVSFLTNTSSPYTQHQNFINGLHMTSYGVNDVTAYSVLLDYEEHYTDEGFTSYTTGIKRGTGWTAYAEIWYNDMGMGRAITVADGSTVHSAYGFDVVLITSYGPVLDYYDYVNFLSMY